MSRLDIAVVGAGTAGSAAALFLARAGHRVTLYERVLDPSPVGAGIVLQPTGLSVLTLLGPHASVLERAERLDRLWCTTPSGRTVVDLSYEVVSPDAFGLGVHRGVLFETLFRAALAEPGIEVRLGVGGDDLQHHRDGVSLIDRVTSRSHGPHQLIVVCNGARSSLRDDTAHHKSVRTYPWGALWAVVPDLETRSRGVLRQVVNGTQRLIGLLPTGRGPSGAKRLVSLFFSLKTSQLAAFRAGDFAGWKRGVHRDLPETSAVLDQLKSPDDLLFSEYHDVVMWPWNIGRVVYLGDAAHATSPQMGQGCNLALLDAWVLSQCLAQHAEVNDALFAYSSARRSHLRWYQFITRWLTPFFQSDLWPLGLMRDAIFGPSTSIPFVRRQMVEGMAGISRGPLARPLALPR